MMDYLRQAEGAVRGTRIVSDIAISWFGKRSPAPPRPLRLSLSPEARRSHLLSVLCDRLYRDFYCAGTARPSSSDSDHFTASEGFVPAMSRANTGAGCWEPGWVVSRIEGDRLGVCREGLEVWVRPSDCLDPALGHSTPDSEPPSPGTGVCVRMPAESFETSPGYYSALSNTPFQRKSEEVLTRIYFNLRPDQAPRGVAAITGELNAAHIPFRLKVLRDEHSYTRCDTAVLYLRGPDVPLARDPLLAPSSH
jgi:hypothetical protein